MDYHIQILEFLSLLPKHGLSSPKTWTVICNFWNLFPFSKKQGLSYANIGIYFPPPKAWTIICNFWKFFPFSHNVDYHIQILEFLSLLPNMDYLFQKYGLSYSISKISFPSPKTWIVICKFWNFFPFSKTWTIICNYWNFF